jgi:DICT domain-containing protein
MTLGDLIRNAESREKTLTVYGSSDDAAELREYFASQQVTVAEGTATGAPDGFAVLSDGGRTLAAVDTADLSGPLTATVGRERALGDLLEHLDDTTFTSYDPTQMLATTREIEDRAWRVGSGRIHAGFQCAEAFETQRPTYGDLARKALDIDVYLQPSDGLDAPEGVTVHEEEGEEIERTWFVAFDGDGDDAHKCALLAEERGDLDAEGRDREFYGVWTYDPELVDAAIGYLDRTYLDHPTADGGLSVHE